MLVGTAFSPGREVIVSRLWSDFLNNQGRVIHKWKHYVPAYEQHFSRFVER